METDIFQLIIDKDPSFAESMEVAYGKDWREEIPYRIQRNIARAQNFSKICGAEQLKHLWQNG